MRDRTRVDDMLDVLKGKKSLDILDPATEFHIVYPLDNKDKGVVEGILRRLPDRKDWFEYVLRGVKFPDGKILENILIAFGKDGKATRDGFTSHDVEYLGFLSAFCNHLADVVHEKQAKEKKS